MNPRSWTQCVAAGVVSLQLGGVAWAEDNAIFKANVAPDKWGTQAELQTMDKLRRKAHQSGLFIVTYCWLFVA